MTKSHAWRFFADGARQPASAILFRSSSDTGSDVYSRTLRRARIASQASMSSFRLRLWRQCDRDLVSDHGAIAVERHPGTDSQVPGQAVAGETPPRVGAGRMAVRDAASSLG